MQILGGANNGLADPDLLFIFALPRSLIGGGGWQRAVAIVKSPRFGVIRKKSVSSE
jgi:hypothetical protein